MVYTARANKRKYKRYKKRYNKRTSRYSRYAKYARNTADVATKALAIAYGVKRLMNVEFKYHDVVFLSATIGTTGSITHLTNIPQGDTAITRDGAQVKLTRLMHRYIIKGNTSATHTTVRAMLIHDKQTNQAQFTLADLLEDTSAVDNLLSPLNLDNKFRFEVLYNKVHSFQNTGHNNINKEVKMALDLKLRFDASTPSIADLTSSSLHMLFISDLSSNQPTVISYTRLRFVDN